MKKFILSITSSVKFSSCNVVMIVINRFQRNSVQRNVIKSVGNVNCLVILRTSDKKASSFNKNQLTFSEKLWESICAVR